MFRFVYVDMPANLRRIAFLAFVAAFPGCERDDTNLPADSANRRSDDHVQTTASPASGPPSAPDNAAAAIAVFQSQALAVLPKDLTPEMRAFAVRAINNREHLHGRLLTCLACFQRIDGTLTPKERESLILFGTIDDLRAQSGNCWEIMSFGGFGNSIEGYVDADTGKLLVLWIVPEG